MKARTHVHFFQNGRTFESQIVALLHRLDHAIAPLGTASLVLGLTAIFLKINSLADYLLATGLLFHLTVWFVDWVKSADSE